MTEISTLQTHALDSLKANLIVPPGYEVRAGSTVVWTTNRAGEQVALEMCANPIGVCARARDRDGVRWATRMAWLTPDSKYSEMLVPSHQLAGQANAVMDELTKRGVLFNPKALAHFRSYLFECQRDPRVPFERTVSHLGFTDALGESELSFVLPGKVIRPVLADGEAPSNERLLFQPTNPVASLEGYHSAGDLPDWKSLLAPFGDHPLIVVAAQVGLAGAFPRVAGEENGGIHLHGPTSSGKTCAAQVCASVVGFPGNPSRGGDARALFQTWNTTPNAVEMLLAPHSGMPVILDEVGANDAGVNLYNAFSGLAKARMTELGGLREQNTWSVLVLSTGEYSVRDHIEQSEVGRVTDGTAVRFQDVPILGVYEAAERLGAPPLPDAQNLAEPIRHLQEQLGQCYGTAMPAFVERLYAFCHEQGVGLAPLIRSRIQACHTRLSEEAQAQGFELGSARRRALNRLAMVAAIGQLAVELGILPFSSEQAWRAVAAVRDTWLSHTQFVSPEDKIIEHLQNYCIAHFQHVRIADQRATPPAKGWPFFYFERLGFIVFTKEQLLRAAGTTSLRTVTKVLREKGWLPGKEQGHADAKLREDMKGVVPGTRAFQVLAKPVLGEFLQNLDVVPVPAPVRPVRQLSCDEDGVVLGLEHDDGPPDYPRPYEPPVVQRVHDDDDPGPTYVMPKRRAKLPSPTRH